MRLFGCIAAVCLGLAGWVGAAEAPAGVGTLPHLQVDVNKKQIRVECQALDIEAPLEFLCVVTGTNEHEALLRSDVKPSHLHTAMLMLGLKPGLPVRYSEVAKKWLPPHGPPLHIFLEYQKDGTAVRLPANRWMRNVKTHKSMPALTWIFAGSRVMDDGAYAADVTGYLVSVVNFELTVIDIPDLASNANETLEWERDPAVAPKAGTPVTLVIEPAGANESATQPPPPTTAQTGTEGAEIDAVLLTVDASGQLSLNHRPVAVDHLTEALTKMKADRPVHVRLSAAEGADAALLQKVTAAVESAGVPLTRMTGSDDTPRVSTATSQQRIAALRKRWEQDVAPRHAALREAAQAHYEVLNALRHEQQRLLDEAEGIQRVIDKLERQYQDMTTPHPEPAEK